MHDQQIVYLWADGLYVKAGIGKDKAALLVLVGARADGTKKVLAVESGYRESSRSWANLLRSVKKRGLGAPRFPSQTATIWRGETQPAASTPLTAPVPLPSVRPLLPGPLSTAADPPPVSESE